MTRAIHCWMSGFALITAVPALGQSAGAAAIEQISGGKPPVSHTAVEPIPKNRSSATAQNPAAERVPDLVSAETLAACQRAQADDRPAPSGVDCVRALQVSAASKAAPSAEGSLLRLFGQNAEVTNQSSPDATGSVSADQVARQLSSGEFQGTSGSDAAASVARDRPPPQAAPPPR